MKKILFTLLAAATATMAQAAVETGKTYRIVPVGNTTKSLFVRNSSLSANAAVVLWAETDRPAQQWTATAGTTEGTFSFRNVYTGRYLSLRNGSLVQAANSRLWTLEPADDDDNTYTLRIDNSYLRTIQYDDGTQPAASATQQQWKLIETEPQTQLTEAIRQRMLNGFLQQFMQDKGSGHRTFANGGWSESEMQEVILDAYEATGDPAILGIFEASYDLLKYHVGNYWNGGTQVGGYGWYGYSFNDDVMWEIIAAARAYHLTGKRLYLDDAKRNFDLIWNRAYLGYVGLLRWAEQDGDRNSANSCVNGPAEVAACYIAAGLGDETYFEKAKELYTNQRKYLYDSNTGRVYDNAVFDPATATVKSQSTWASTYNQGTMLGAAVLLYRHYGDEMYRQDAEKIIGYSRSNLCNGDGIISVCQDVANNDLQGFKGILMRYAGLYVNEFDDADYKEWMIRNAMHAYCNQNSRDFGHTAWLVKANEDLQQDGKDYGGRPFGASTSIPAAYGVRLNDLYVVTGNATTKEDNTLTADKAEREGDSKMVFTYRAAKAGHYQARVSYRTDANRSMYIDVNGAGRQSQSFNNTNGHVNLRPLFVTLREGDNTIELGNATTQMPEVTQIELVYLAPVSPSLEAEHARSFGSVNIQKDDRASGRQYIGNLGNGAANYVTFYYDADEAGDYDLTIYYYSAADRNMYYQLNGGTKVRRAFGSTGSWNGSQPVGTKTIRIQLKAGQNTISLGNETAAAPNVDKIELTRVPEESGIVTIDTDGTPAGTSASYDLRGVSVNPSKVHAGSIYIQGGHKVVRR